MMVSSNHPPKTIPHTVRRRLKSPIRCMLRSTNRSNRTVWPYIGRRTHSDLTRNSWTGRWPRRTVQALLVCKQTSEFMQANFEHVYRRVSRASEGVKVILRCHVATTTRMTSKSSVRDKWNVITENLSPEIQLRLLFTEVCLELYTDSIRDWLTRKISWANARLSFTRRLSVSSMEKRAV